MNKQKRLEIFQRLAEAIPEPETELNYSNPFELLIAVILSAQATDKGVNIATAKLFPVANTPEAIYALGEDGLKEYIKTIGLFNTKGANIIKTCKMLMDLHNSQGAGQPKRLGSLPGVGRKPPMSSSTPHLANRPWRWTPIFSASPTAPISHRAKPCWK